MKSNKIVVVLLGLTIALGIFNIVYTSFVLHWLVGEPPLWLYKYDSDFFLKDADSESVIFNSGTISDFEESYSRDKENEEGEK